MAYLRILVATILAVGIAIALPAVENAATARLTLEVGHRAGQIAALLVRTVPAVIRTVADRRRRCAVAIATLERTGPAVPCRAAVRFVRRILTVRFAVAPPEPRYALLVRTAAPVLPGRTVGDAGLLVPRQVELVRASAPVARCTLLHVTLDIQVGRLERWCQQAKMRTAPIPGTARIGVRDLAQRVANVDIVRTVRRVPDHRVVRPGELVRPQDRLQVPVGPVQAVVEDGERKHVRYARTGQHDVPVATLQIGERDVIEMRIRPVDPIGEVVDRQCVRPGDVVLPREDAGKVGPIHAHLGDVRLQVPGGEVQVPDARVYDDRARIHDAAAQRLAPRPIQLRHIQVLRVPIEPVQLPADPVDRDTLETVRVMLDHRFLLDPHIVHQRTEARAEDGFRRHVAEVHLLPLHVEVDRDHVHQVLVDQVVLVAVDRHVAHVVLVAEDEPRFRPVLALARVLVILPLVVPLVALAVIAARCVGAVLRAHARCFDALVNVRAGLAILQQFVALVAVTVVAGERVNALVAAPVNLDLGTLVDVAVQRFVRLVRTVRYLVADELIVDALAAGAGKLAVRAGRVLLPAPDLVRMVTAVILAVAPVLVPDALEVLAGELLRCARLVLAVAALALVRTVPAVIIVIAHPAPIDAAPVGTRKLIVGARLGRWAVVPRRVLIRTVHTVRITVADPLARYTLCPCPRLVLVARKLRIVVALPIVTLMPPILVATVQTIVVTIADVDPRYAVPIVARKQITEAGPALRFAVLGRFVRPIPAIVIAVAVPGGRYAPMVRTPEAVLRAGALGAV
uniref:Secreted protein n=1 Tax=Anopheles darlingi TaxID=43151 RepID=A0A2M4D189_ANODA